MGEINHIRCKQCGYKTFTRSGPGFTLFRKLKTTEEALLNGEIENQEALNCLKSEGKLCVVAAYLCPVCKEFCTSDQMYFITNLKYSMYGTLHYDVVFPFGKPKCSVCDTELIYIKNIRSSKVKCPKCGGELAAKLSGYYD